MTALYGEREREIKEDLWRTIVGAGRDAQRSRLEWTSGNERSKSSPPSLPLQRLLSNHCLAEHKRIFNAAILVAA